MNKTLGLIVARGGSKRIPYKNIKRFCGKPLTAWTIIAAKECKRFDKIIVSTEDPEIAKIACSFGAEVPFMRPKILASDKSNVFDTTVHAIRQFPDFDTVVLLQPTSPLRTVKNICDCLNLHRSLNSGSTASFKVVAPSIDWLYFCSINKSENNMQVS